MRVKILEEFHDKDNYAIIYQVGTVCEFNDSRAASIIERKLAEEVKEEVRPKKIGINEDK